MTLKTCVTNTFVWMPQSLTHPLLIAPIRCRLEIWSHGGMSAIHAAIVQLEAWENERASIFLEGHSRSLPI